MVCPCISCIDCCVGRANSARAGPDLVGGSSGGGGGHDSLQLALVVFSFHQLVQTFHLYSCNLHCVMGWLYLVVVVMGSIYNITVLRNCFYLYYCKHFKGNLQDEQGLRS